MLKLVLDKVYSILDIAQRKEALVQMIFSIIGMALETLGIGLIVPIIAILSNTSSFELAGLKSVMSWYGAASASELIYPAVLAFALIQLTKVFFLGFMGWYQGRFVTRLQSQLSERLFSHYMRLPYEFHLVNNSAYLIRNTTSEVAHTLNKVIMPLIQLFSESCVAFGLFILLMVMEPWGSVISFLVLGVAGFFFGKLTRGRIRQYATLRQHHEGEIFRLLQQGFGGVKDLKLLGRELDVVKSVGEHIGTSSRIQHLTGVLQLLPRLWIEILAVISLVLLILVMIWRGRDPASIVPVLAVFAASAFRLMPSVNKILVSLQNIRLGLPALDILARELSLVKGGKKIECDNAPGVSLLHRFELRDVSYSYPQSAKPSLTGVSFFAEKGEAVAIIGESGAGKSTLVDILLGLLAPHSGQILCDDVNVLLNLRFWQSQIGYVPQAIFLSDETIRRNVAFGLPEDQIDDPAVWRSLKDAQLEEFVLALPAGLDTIVGERGVRLSGGQRQRIGIARALYHNPSILVMDEATSALDSSTEDEVMKAVYGLKRTKTLIIIAHRLTTISFCDRVYELGGGRVISVKKQDLLSRP
jgi:ATP-binding cassette, subfamily B, bacterial PglK